MTMVETERQIAGSLELLAVDERLEIRKLVASAGVRPAGELVGDGQMQDGEPFYEIVGRVGGPTLRVYSKTLAHAIEGFFAFAVERERVSVLEHEAALRQAVEFAQARRARLDKVAPGGRVTP